MWHVTHDTQEVVNIVSKMQVPSSYGLGVKVIGKFWVTYSLNQLMKTVFLEQPQLHRVW